MIDRALSLNLFAIGLLLATVQICHSQVPLTPPPSPAPQNSAAPPPPPTPIPFDDALSRAANDLFSKANVPPGPDKIELVIDPLIDAATGAQSSATRLMQERIKDLVNKSYPRFVVRPFSSEALGRAPVVLIGTFTAINNAGAPDGVRDAYRIRLALADLRSKSIVSKGVARAKPEAVKADPTPAFADAPIWTSDPATSVYIKTCQGSKPGDPIDPFYIERICDSRLLSATLFSNMTTNATGKPWRSTAQRCKCRAATSFVFVRVSISRAGS